MKMDILKMSKIEKSKYFLENTLKVNGCDENALIFKKWREKVL
jgi:hypothetical protein